MAHFKNFIHLFPIFIFVSIGFAQQIAKCAFQRILLIISNLKGGNLTAIG